MDEAWFAIIGGAVGAAGTLAASALTQAMASRSAKDARADERKHAMDRYLLEERKSVYLEAASSAIEAVRSISNFREAAQRDDQASMASAWDRMQAVQERLLIDHGLLIYATTDLQQNYQALAETMRIYDRPPAEVKVITSAVDQDLRQQATVFLTQIRAELGVSPSDA